MVGVLPALWSTAENAVLLVKVSWTVGQIDSGANYTQPLHLDSSQCLPLRWLVRVASQRTRWTLGALVCIAQWQVLKGGTPLEW